MTTTIKQTKVTEIKITDNQPVEKEDDVIIIRPGLGEKKIRFRCGHCGAIFLSANWHRTRGRHYSTMCPCCSYSAWAK